MYIIKNGKEWSAVWSEIIHVISKLNDRLAQVALEITSVNSNHNTRHEVQSPFYYIHF